MNRGGHPVQYPRFSPRCHRTSAGVELIGMFDGRLLQELEHGRQEKQVIAVDVPVGDGCVEGQFSAHCLRFLRCLL